MALVPGLASDGPVIAEVDMGADVSAPTVRATVVQASTVFYDTPATLDTPKINRDLLRLAKGRGLADVLLTIPSEERDAPTILKYDPTYGGRIRAKDVAKPSEDLPEAKRPSKARPLRGSIRLPTDAEPFEEENMPPRSIEAMLQKKLEEKQKGGSAGASGSVKAPPPPLSQKRPSSTSAPTEDTPAPASKRVKTTAKKSSTGGDGVRIGELGAASEGAKEKGKETATEVAWVPNFITPDKKQVLKSDSLKEDHSLGFTLHAGLMLPKDITAPPSLKAALSEYYYYVGRATQSIMSTQLYLTEHDKQAKLLKQKVMVCQNSAEDYKKSLERSEETRRNLELEVANLSDLVKGLQDVADQARAEGKDEGLQEGVALGRKEMEGEMKKSLGEEYNRGYAQCEDDAVDQLVEVQAKIKEAQHKRSFMLGFNAGLDEVGVDPTDERRDLMVPPRLPADEVVAEEPSNADPTETPTETPSEQQTAETTPAEA